MAVDKRIEFAVLQLEKELAKQTSEAYRNLKLAEGKAQADRTFLTRRHMLAIERSADVKLAIEILSGASEWADEKKALENRLADVRAELEKAAAEQARYVATTEQLTVEMHRVQKDMEDAQTALLDMTSKRDDLVRQRTQREWARPELDVSPKPSVETKPGGNVFLIGILLTVYAAGAGAAFLVLTILR